MARLFSPDLDLIDNYAHSVYRYKTNEIGEDGTPIYMPVAFQNDLEDITLIYDHIDLTEFDPTDAEDSVNVFQSVIRNYDDNIASDVAANKMDMFQLIQRMSDFMHVGSKLLASKHDLPTKMSQLTNDSSYITSSDIQPGSTTGSLNFGGVEVTVKGLGEDDDTGYALKDHTHDVSEITLEGYVRPETSGVIRDTDDLKTAVGKLERAITNLIGGDMGTSKFSIWVTNN